MATKYCTLCERPVEARRNIGFGTIILALLTAGLWLIAIPFYRQRCSICKSTSLTATESKKGKDSGRRTQWGLILAAVIVIGVVANVFLPIPTRQGSSGSGASEVDPAIKTVGNHITSNKLDVKTSMLRSTSNPHGEGTIVYVPKTQFDGVERKIIWLVIDGQAFPLNRATKGTVTPDLPWPRDAQEELWSRTGLSPYSATDAIKVAFGSSS